MRLWCPRVAIRPALPIAALLALSLISPVAAQPVPIPAGVAASPLPDGDWVVNFQTAPLFAGPGEDTEYLGQLRQYTYLDVRGYEDTWARVYNPRTRVMAYIPSELLGPTEGPPPPYISAEPPPTLEPINVPGRVLRTARVSFYPTSEGDAQIATLPHNTPVHIVDSVQGDDGGVWYRTNEGDYLQPGSVRIPRAAPRGFGGKWIDADLSEPVMVTAYEGEQMVATALAIKGAGRYPTPTGLFSIGRRVANETMNSETIGIPRFAPGGYYLTNVLFTQYFTGDGASLHYNYWSGNFGYAGSHGCLGLSLDDSRFFWDWATIGTPVYIHY
jgi:hypothetical protein